MYPNTVETMDKYIDKNNNIIIIARREIVKLEVILDSESNDGDDNDNDNTEDDAEQDECDPLLDETTGIKINSDYTDVIVQATVLPSTQR